MSPYKDCDQLIICHWSIVSGTNRSSSTDHCSLLPIKVRIHFSTYIECVNTHIVVLGGIQFRVTRLKVLVILVSISMLSVNANIAVLSTFCPFLHSGEWVVF